LWNNLHHVLSKPNNLKFVGRKCNGRKKNKRPKQKKTRSPIPLNDFLDYG
jgi:hypothetical protein